MEGHRNTDGSLLSRVPGTPVSDFEGLSGPLDFNDILPVRFSVTPTRVRGWRLKVPGKWFRPRPTPPLLLPHDLSPLPETHRTVVGTDPEHQGSGRKGSHWDTLQQDTQTPLTDRPEHASPYVGHIRTPRTDTLSRTYIHRDPTPRKVTHVCVRLPLNEAHVPPGPRGTRSGHVCPHLYRRREFPGLVPLRSTTVTTPSHTRGLQRSEVWSETIRWEDPTGVRCHPSGRVEVVQ